MKKLLKILLFLFATLLFTQAVFFFALDASLLGFPHVYIPFEDKYLIRGEGSSMEPTLHNEDILFINRFDKTPEPGKIMSLKLNTLIDADTNESVFQETFFVKRIKEINSDGCIWFEGDNVAELSMDSRDWGWFCDGDYEIAGTIMFKD